MLQQIFTSSCNRRLSHMQRTATLLWSQFSHEGWGTWFLCTNAAWRHNPGRWLTMLILWNTHTCRKMWMSDLKFSWQQLSRIFTLSWDMILLQFDRQVPLLWGNFLPAWGQESLLYPEDDGSRFLRNSGNYWPDYMPSSVCCCKVIMVVAGLDLCGTGVTGMRLHTFSHLITMVQSASRTCCDVLWTSTYVNIIPHFHVIVLDYDVQWNPNLVLLQLLKRTHGSTVGWGTMLQAGRSWVQIPMRSLDFSIYLILLAALWPWGWLSL
jgi:hypothetical protein